MNPVSFEPVKVEAIIHSLGEKREVFIVLYDEPNRVRAVYNNKYTANCYKRSVSKPLNIRQHIKIFSRRYAVADKEKHQPKITIYS